MTISERQIKSFQQKIFQFYQQNKRDLPWRHTTDSYKILLSELMLQQTQVNRVITYFQTWTTKWPTIADLAAASRKEILQEWMGLGYNSRAINLHKAAEKIVTEYQGDVLQAVQDYKNIPGVGPYTSKAVQIFADNADLVTVDTNIRRILINEFSLDENISEKELWKLAYRCLPRGKSRDWHNALMDYGALYLTSRKTGIRPKTIQSPFEGSDRQIRAQILRLLLHSSLDFTTINNEIKTEEERLHRILEKMVNQGMIQIKDNQYHLHE